eukprot:TRINITY_DN17975_c0_g1_i1.p2 TRINITY_DN17975_c0_g1~~TRINITY_DN17975_c0_g1_i1.p2  ORF type:complete len:136 (+),score=28.16 TRINITY_DN17975_c0_g1_i1:1-408(+)
MRAAITPNTIMVAGSAPSYAHGMVDPIPEIAALAQEFDIGCHVDGCLGGFLLPWFNELNEASIKLPLFDFRVPGVTSMSADTHKYGYSVKGSVGGALPQQEAAREHVLRADRVARRHLRLAHHRRQQARRPDRAT